jgi:hypothetical protein
LPFGRGALLLGGIDCVTFTVLSGFAGLFDLLLSRRLRFLPLLNCTVTGGF